MHDRNPARELGLLAATLAVLVHYLDGPAFWLGCLIMVVAVMAATVHLLGERWPWRVGFDRLALPGLAAVAGAGFGHLVSPVPWLAVVFACTWLGVSLAAYVEVEPPANEESSSATATATATTRIVILGVAFLAFAALGGFVSGGMPTDRSVPGGDVIAGTALFDAAIGAVAGFLLTALRRRRATALVGAVVGYGVILGAAGALLRVAAMPRLLGPAILTLVAYLIASFVDRPWARGRTALLVAETLVLAAAGCTVVVVGLLIR